MAIDDPYIALEALKVRIGIADNRNDAAITQAILAASRQIDSMTGRNFNRTASGTARHFSPMSGASLIVSDVVSVSEIAADRGSRTFDEVWADTDFDLWPYDAAERGRPYTQIKVASSGGRSFPIAARAIRVTGVWGWPSVPAQIVEATAIQANRYFKRQSAPFGVVGSPELGQMQTISSLDPDVKQMVMPFRVAMVF